jgi:hypothetical protein
MKVRSVSHFAANEIDRVLFALMNRAEDMSHAECYPASKQHWERLAQDIRHCRVRARQMMHADDIKETS